MENLTNLHILVTRPEPQGRELCRLITAQGGHAINFPTIDFGPPQDKAALENALNILNEQDWLIFISPQSVYASVNAIIEKWPSIQKTVKIAAVGSGTVKALQQSGFTVTVQPKQDWNSEGVLDLPEFQSVKKKKIAIIRGMGGREKIDKVLAERGAQILPVLAYERILPKTGIHHCLNLLEQGMIDMIVCTSYESVKNLKILLGEGGWPYIKEIPVIVMSERIKILAHDLGFRRIWVTRHASQEAILEIMAEKRKEL